MTVDQVRALAAPGRRSVLVLTGGRLAVRVHVGPVVAAATDIARYLNDDLAAAFAADATSGPDGDPPAGDAR